MPTKKKTPKTRNRRARVGSLKKTARLELRIRPDTKRAIEQRASAERLSIATWADRVLYAAAIAGSTVVP